MYIYPIQKSHKLPNPKPQSHAYVSILKQTNNKHTNKPSIYEKAHEPSKTYAWGKLALGSFGA